MFDLLITDALVIDGGGSPGWPGWVAITDGRIAAVERSSVDAPEAARVIDVGGAALCPGFVDVHNHSDLAPLVEPAFASTVHQGVTTVVVGNCGTSPWPKAGVKESAEMVGASPTGLGWRSFGDWMDAMSSCAPAVNIAALVGHGAVRAEVMGTARRAPDHAELTSMRRLVAAAMDEGAVGLSTGLIYVPGIFAELDEIAELASESRRRGGIYASHIRGEGEPVFRAIAEALEIGRRAETPVHISHLKCETEPMWGNAEELLRIIHGAPDASADQYPYTAWESILSSLLPPWAPVEQLEDIALAEPERLRTAVEVGEPGFQSSVNGVGWASIVIENSADPAWDGKSVAALADTAGIAPFQMFVRLLVARADTGCIGHAMAEADIRTILADPAIMVASDAMAMSPQGPLGSQPVHPRNYGTFPRVLGRYVREGVLSLETAIAKMTSIPAARFGLQGRGMIEPGAAADAVIFHPDRIEDTAGYDAPHSFPSGIDLVLVNGRIAMQDGMLRDRAGQMLRR